MYNHYKTFQNIILELSKLSSGKSQTKLPNGKFVRPNELGDLFEFDVPKMMFGDKLVKSTKEDDIERHIDWHMDEKTYDFKAPKRKHNKFQQGEILVEFTNVNGKKGWLFGEEDYLMIGYIIDDEFYYLKYNTTILADYVIGMYMDGALKFEDSREDRDDVFAWIVPPGLEGGLVDVYRISEFVDEALHQKREEKFHIIETLNKERNENRQAS